MEIVQEFAADTPAASTEGKFANRFVESIDTIAALMTWLIGPMQAVEKKVLSFVSHETVDCFQRRLNPLACKPLVDRAIAKATPDSVSERGLKLQMINIILAETAHCHRVDSFRQ
jgi:hypothetical protein